MEKQKTISITVDKSLINKIGILALTNDIPRRKLIEQALKEFLEKNNVV